MHCLVHPDSQSSHIPSVMADLSCMFAPWSCICVCSCCLRTLGFTTQHLGVGAHLARAQAITDNTLFE